MWPGFTPVGRVLKWFSPPSFTKMPDRGLWHQFLHFRPLPLQPCLSRLHFPVLSSGSCARWVWCGPRAARPGPRCAALGRGPPPTWLPRGGSALSALCPPVPGACLLVRVSDSFPESAGSPGGDAAVPASKQALSPACRRLPLQTVPPRVSAACRKQQFTHHYFNNTCSSP